MAKRLTDTAKWDKQWFRKLGSRLRDIRQYCLDRCDHAGILEIDLETFEHYIGEPVTLDDIRAAFRDEVEEFDGDKLFIPAFVEFQYGALNPENRAHFSVISILKNKGLKRPLQGCKDKDKDKDKDKEGERFQKFAEQVYDLYPKRPGTGKGPGVKSLARQFAKNPEWAEPCQIAAQNYANYCTTHGTEPRFIKTFKVWCGSLESPHWREWLDVQIVKRAAGIGDIVER